MVIRSARSKPEQPADPDAGRQQHRRQQHRIQQHQRGELPHVELMPDAVRHALAERDIDHEQDRAAIDQAAEHACCGRPMRRSTAAQAARRRTAAAAAARCRPRRAPRIRHARSAADPASSGVSRMPNRLDAVAAHSAAATLPRAIEVKAIEDCTVDGSTHSISTPAHSGGVSSPGAIARAVSPSAGNTRKVLPSTTACSRQCRAPASAAWGASRAPCRKNISAIIAVPPPLATVIPRPVCRAARRPAPPCRGCWRCRDRWCSRESSVSHGRVNIQPPAAHCEVRSRHAYCNRKS